MGEKKCCSLWVILTIVLVLAAIVVTTCLVLKKLHMLRNHYRPAEEGYWPEETDEKASDNGVRYTTDQDFV